MMRYGWMLLVVLLLAGCVRVLPDTGTAGHRTLNLALTPDQLYVRSMRTLAALGVAPTMHDADSHVIMATFPGESQPLRIVASRSVLGHTLTLDGPESAITTFIAAFDAQR